MARCRVSFEKNVVDQDPFSGFASSTFSDRWAASIANERTGNLKLAQKFLGHSTIGMTADIYTHTSADAELEAAVTLERAIYGGLFPVVPNFGTRNNSAAPNHGKNKRLLRLYL